MVQLRMTLLGGFQAHSGTGEILSVPSRKAQALLAYLALPVGRAHPREKLAALLWGGIREESARASLRQTLFVLRKALQSDHALEHEGDLLRLEPTRVDADVAAFELAAMAGTPESLTRAAALYNGDLLAGLALDEAPFEEWLVSERERLRELALAALARLLAHQRKTAAPEAALQTALKLLSIDPLQESVHRVLMRLYAEIGRREAALRQYQHCVGLLRRELGIEPETETKTLYQEILRQRSRRASTGPSMTRPAVQTIERQTPGVETELIGRSAEIERLLAELDDAARGAGRVVAVVGEAGIGKSRLVTELANAAGRRDMTVCVGRSYESEQILPFGPWVGALRTGQLSNDSELLAALPPALRPELARLLPEMNAAADRETGAADVRLIFESVAHLIGLLAERQPVLWILEDLHWADEMSARLLAFVGRRLTGHPALLVVTAREEELTDAPVLRQALTDLQRESLLTIVSLEPLSRGDTQRLVRAVGHSANEAALERLGEQAWTASEGNPFVAVETVRAEAEGDLLPHRAGLALPERVRDMVGRRLERLSEHGQALSAVAAVIGREFEFALLHRSAGLGEDETAAGVEELVRRGVLHGRGERFDFVHDRIREVAHGRVLAPRRKLLHRKVAEAIEALYAGDLGSHELALGLHYRDAEVWDLAARHLVQAGFSARKRAANREAVACFDAMLECLKSLPEDRARSGRVIDAILHRESASMPLGEFRRSLDGLYEAEALARDLGDRGRLGQILSRFAYNFGSLGDLDRAIENADQARALAIDVGDVASQHSSNVVLARGLYARGDYRRAMDAVRENDALELGAPPRPPTSGRQRTVSPTFSRVWGVLALAELGEFDEAMRRADEAMRLSVGELGRHGDIWSRLGVGRFYLIKSDVAPAIDVLEHVLPMCEEGSDLAVYFSRIAASLGGGYALAGRLEEAVSVLERADRHAGTIGFAYGHALVLATLAEARLLAGDVPGAVAAAERALASCRQHGQRGWEAWSLRIAGEIAVHRDRSDLNAAENSFNTAMALADERGMRPLLAHCRLGLAHVHHRRGERKRARAETMAAISEYRAMDMPYWRARAEVELTGLG